MDHLHSFQHFLQTFTQGSDAKPGFISFCICLANASFAFVTAFIDLPNMHQFQQILAMCASVVAMVSGGFAIRYYRTITKKANQSNHVK
jgi:hypothetical protein